MNHQLKDDYFGQMHVTIIDPPGRWPRLDLKELLAYRELFWVLIVRDIKVRYKQTVLGASWAILQPLAMMVIFSIFFGRFAKIPSDGFPYPVFVYAGLLPWFFFANSVTASGNSLIASKDLVSKVYFPRLIIPLSSVGVGLLDFCISAIFLLALMGFYGMEFGPALVLVPLLAIAVVFTATGVGMMLSALNVAYRDFRYVIPFLIQLWFFITPVVYPSSLIPENWRWLIFINPMTGLVESFRAVFLSYPADTVSISLSFLSALLIFFAGVTYFQRVERRFADII